MTDPHEFMECQPGSCALPHPLPSHEEEGCHWPYGNVFFGGTRPYHRGDPICMLTRAQHRASCFMCDPSILEGRRCATGAPICEAHREELGLERRTPRQLDGEAEG